MERKLEEKEKLAKELYEFVLKNASSTFMNSVFDEKFKEYLLKGASVELLTSEIFHELIAGNKTVSIKNYVAFGADVNVKDPVFNVTPLYFSLLERQIKPFNITYLTLLSLNADPTVKTRLNPLKPTALDILMGIDLTDFEQAQIKKYLNLKKNDVDTK